MPLEGHLVTRKLGFLTAVPAEMGKADLGKGYWNPRRKLGVTMHFSEIIKLQFGKKLHTLFCILAIFRIFVALLCGYPQFSFWIPIALAKICFSCIVKTHAKILCY